MGIIYVGVQIFSPDKGLFIVAGSDVVISVLSKASKKINWRHVNRKELTTQLALIKHFERTGGISERFLILNDDHWHVTMQAFFELFAEGTAVIRDRFGQRCILVNSLTRTKWENKNGPSDMHSWGEQYVTKDGEIVLSWVTAIS